MLIDCLIDDLGGSSSNSSSKNSSRNNSPRRTSSPPLHLSTAAAVTSITGVTLTAPATVTAAVTPSRSYMLICYVLLLYNVLVLFVLYLYFIATTFIILIHPSFSFMHIPRWHSRLIRQPPLIHPQWISTGLVPHFLFFRLRDNWLVKKVSERMKD